MSKVDGPTGGGRHKRKHDQRGSNTSAGGGNSNGRIKPGGRWTTQKTVLAGDPRDIDRIFNNTKNAFSRTAGKIAAQWGFSYAKSEPKKS
jgi:hypothetical protein